MVGSMKLVFFFFQAEDGIRDATVTGVQTCALPISGCRPGRGRADRTSRPGRTDAAASSAGFMAAARADRAWGAGPSSRYIRRLIAALALKGRSRVTMPSTSLASAARLYRKRGLRVSA